MPYKGSAPSVTDLLGGQTHFTIDGMLILIPQVKAGKFRALAVARPERWPDLPNVPTFVESGFPDLIIDAWTGVVAPKGTPAPIVAKLNAAINEGLQTDEIKAALARFSALPKAGSPQEFEAFLREQLPKWASMVKLAGAKGRVMCETAGLSRCSRRRAALGRSPRARSSPAAHRRDRR